MNGLLILLVVHFFSSAQTDAFKFAKGLFDDSLYTLAREEFVDFIRKYPESPRLSDAKYYAADCLYRERKYESAVKEFESFRSQYPNARFSKDASLKIGRSYYEIGNYDKAVTAYSESTLVGLDESNYWLGECYFKLGQYEKAIEFYNLVSGQSPYRDYILYSIGFAYFQLKQYDESMEYFRELQAQFPDSKLVPEGRFFISKALYGKGEYEVAIDSLKKIVAEAEKHKDEAQFLIAEALYSLKKFEDAVEAYKSCKDTAYAPMVLYGLGNTYYALEDYANAIETFKKLGQFPKYKEYAEERIGMLYYELRNYDKAIEHFKNVESYNAKLIIANSLFAKRAFNDAAKEYITLYETTREEEPLYRAASALYKAKNYNDALKYAQEYLNIGGKKFVSRVYLLLGEINYALKNYAKALKEYALAGTDKEIEKESLYGRISASLALKDIALAYELAKELVEKYPNDETYYKMGDVAYLNGKFWEALKYYKKCSDPMAAFNVGKVYYELGEYDSAIPSLDKFLNSFPLHQKASNAKYYVGMAYRKLGNYEKSNQVLFSLVDLYPSTDLLFEASSTIGDNYYDEGNYKEAETAYRRALDLSSTTEETIRAINGILDSRNGNEGLGSALNVADAFIKRFKDNIIGEKTKLKAGNLCYNEGEYDRAIQYHELVEDKSLKANAKYYMAWTYLSQGKNEDAYKTFEYIAESFPKSEFAPKSLYQLGIFYYKDKDYDKSVASFEQLLSDYPRYDKAQASLNLALSLVGKGKPQKAKAILMEIEEQIPRARVELGFIYFREGEFEKAKGEFELALNGTDKSSEALAQYGLGDIYYEEKKYDDARDAYLKVKYIYNESELISKALYKAGQCEEKLDNPLRAKKFYQMVIDRGDDKEASEKAKQALKNIK